MKEVTFKGQTVWMVHELFAHGGEVSACTGCTFTRPEQSYPRNCAIEEIETRRCATDHSIFIDQTDEAKKAYVAARVAARMNT
jgi:hypothetical protein